MDPDRVDTEKIKVAWISSKDNLPCQIITICDVTEQKSMLSATLLKPLQLFFFFLSGLLTNLTFCLWNILGEKHGMPLTCPS